ELTLKVRRRLRVDGDAGRPSRRKVLEVPFGLHDHQVTIEGQVGELADRFYNLGAKGDVGDELAVHDIDVNPIGATRLAHRNLVRQSCEVGGEDAWRDA